MAAKQKSNRLHTGSHSIEKGPSPLSEKPIRLIAPTRNSVEWRLHPPKRRKLTTIRWQQEEERDAPLSPDDVHNIENFRKNTLRSFMHDARRFYIGNEGSLKKPPQAGDLPTGNAPDMSAQGEDIATSRQHSKAALRQTLKRWESKDAMKELESAVGQAPWQVRFLVPPIAGGSTDPRAQNLYMMMPEDAATWEESTGEELLRLCFVQLSFLLAIPFINTRPSVPYHVTAPRYHFVLPRYMGREYLPVKNDMGLVIGLRLPLMDFSQEDLRKAGMHRLAKALGQSRNRPRHLEDTSELDGMVHEFAEALEGIRSDKKKEHPRPLAADSSCDVRAQELKDEIKAMKKDRRRKKKKDKKAKERNIGSLQSALAPLQPASPTAKAEFLLAQFTKTMEELVSWKYAQERASNLYKEYVTHRSYVVSALPAIPEHVTRSEDRVIRQRTLMNHIERTLEHRPKGADESMKKWEAKQKLANKHETAFKKEFLQFTTMLAASSLTKNKKTEKIHRLQNKLTQMAYNITRTRDEAFKKQDRRGEQIVVEFKVLAEKMHRASAVALAFDKTRKATGTLSRRHRQRMDSPPPSTFSPKINWAQRRVKRYTRSAQR